jgi:hypothetical protein
MTMSRLVIVTLLITALAGCSENVPTQGRYSDPFKPVVDFGKTATLDLLPRQAMFHGAYFDLIIHAKDNQPDLYDRMNNAYESGFVGLHAFFPEAPKVKIICRILVIDHLPENYTDAPPDTVTRTRDHVLLLYGTPSEWEQEILRDTATEIHEIGHILSEPKVHIPWFEEGLCEHLEHLYLVQELPLRAEAEDREWEGIKNDLKIRGSLWAFQPWEEIQKINATLAAMKKKGATASAIDAYYKSSWTAFDLRYRYAWGVVKGMVEHYGHQRFLEILNQYRSGEMGSRDLQRLAAQCMKDEKNEGKAPISQI